jgi:hypothetical protein
MTARCSINILTLQTGINVGKTSAGADMVGTTKIFKREIGQEKIACQIQLLIMINAHQ